MSDKRILPHDYMKQVTSRLDLTMLSTWLTSGSEAMSADGSYNDRLVRECRNIRTLVENTFADEEKLKHATNCLNTALDEYIEVFTEIGIQIGARLMVTLLYDEENRKIMD